MDEKLSTFKHAFPNVSLVCDEIPFCMTGYAVVKKTANNDLSSAVEHAVFSLTEKGAEHIYVGFTDKENARMANKTGSDIALRFSHNMITMQKNIDIFIQEDVLRVQPVTPKDAALFCILYNDAFKYVCNAQHYTTEHVNEFLSEENHRMHFICRGDAIIGFFEHVLCEGHIRIDTLGIEKKYRHTGLGRSVMNVIYEKIISEGFHTVELIVSSTNISAVKLYVKEGFKTKGIRSFWFYPLHTFTFSA